MSSRCEGERGHENEDSETTCWENKTQRPICIKLTGRSPASFRNRARDDLEEISEELMRMPSRSADSKQGQQMEIQGHQRSKQARLTGKENALSAKSVRDEVDEILEEHVKQNGAWKKPSNKTPLTKRHSGNGNNNKIARTCSPLPCSLAQDDLDEISGGEVSSL